MKIAIIAAMSGAFWPRPVKIVNVVADDSTPPQADDDAESTHVHQRVDEEINDETDVAVKIGSDESEQQIAGV